MVIVGNPNESRLVVKPLVLNVLHGGGQVFPSQNDPNAKLIKYWITHPAPLGQDEFSTGHLHHVHAGGSEDRYVQHAMSAATPAGPRHGRG